MSEASEDTRVQIKGTFSVKKRENNGLNRVAELMNRDRLARVPIVGYVEFVRHVDTRDGDEMTVEMIVVEPVIDADGTDPNGFADQVKEMIEVVRKGAGKASVADTLFSGQENAKLDAKLDGQLEGQLAIDSIPEPSGEEIMAERAEAREKARQDDGKRQAVAAVRPDLTAAVTGKPADEVARDKADVAGGIVRPARKPRGTTVRPGADLPPSSVADARKDAARLMDPFTTDADKETATS